MDTLREIYAYRQMIFSLVRKELRGRYKGSFLGFLWTFINPLFQLVVYTMVFSVIMRSGIENYYMFLFVGLIPWIFFATSLTGGAGCVLSQKDMVNKIYFPREVLPIAYVTSSFVNMLYCFAIIFAVLFISGIGVRLQALAYLPLVMVIEYVLALAVAMLSSCVTVYVRDVEHILTILAMAWMYLTPILYSLDMVPKEIQKVFVANPMTSVISAYRDILFYKKAPDLTALLVALAVAAVLLLLGFAVFGRLKRHFAEEI